MTTAATKLATVLLAVASAVALTIATTMPIDAAPARKKSKQARPAAATVTAVSLKDRSRITAPVRRGALGEEVRLPGGSWISCKGDCRETLREETVDFWERQEHRHEQNE